jgi:hypothetical protein
LRERRLVQLFKRLGDQDQETLLAFADFLAGREVTDAPQVVEEPRPVPRPSKESVVAAIKRLSATYPMLDKGRMLNETSSLMVEHVMQGRPASEVIDQLEEVFARHYREHRAAVGKSP